MSVRRPKVLLVDLENTVPKPEEIKNSGFDTVKVVYGAHQENMIKRYKCLSGVSVNFERASKGKNYADFHLCCLVGEMAANGALEIVILSKDTGFQGVMSYAKTRGVRCTQIPSLSTQTIHPTVEKILAYVRRVNRPRNLRTLNNLVLSFFGGKAVDMGMVIEQLRNHCGMSIEEDGRLSWG